jgi:hypothetical protein
VSSFLVLLDKVFLSSRVSHCRHASIRTLCERSFARCMLGVLGSAGAAICLAPYDSALGELNLGQALDAVTGTRLWALSFLFQERFCFYAAAVIVVELLLCNGSYTSPLTHR